MRHKVHREIHEAGHVHQQHVVPRQHIGALKGHIVAHREPRGLGHSHRGEAVVIHADIALHGHAHSGKQFRGIGGELRQTRHAYLGIGMLLGQRGSGLKGMLHGGAIGQCAQEFQRAAVEVKATLSARHDGHALAGARQRHAGNEATQASTHYHGVKSHCLSSFLARAWSRPHSP